MSPLPVSVSLCFSCIIISTIVYFPVTLSLTLCVTYTHTHAQRGREREKEKDRERQNIFISLLYAVCAQPEIAGLTPHCELHRGNVYSNPKEHAINLFLDRRQTIMSLHEGNKDRTPIQDHHDNHLIMKLREAVRSRGARSPRDTFATV